MHACNEEQKEWKSRLNVYVNGTGEKIWALGFDYEIYSQVVLMQYTGLKDKNGTEIYEGDVVKILYTDWPSQTNEPGTLEEYLDSLARTKVVIWSVQGFYVSESVDGYAESMEPGKYGYIEVIGNIYENKELLDEA